MAGRQEGPATADQDRWVRPDRSDSSGARAAPRAAQARVLVQGACEYVFTTRTGAPLRQRNVGRAPPTAQRDAVAHNGKPTFPVLHRRDDQEDPIPVAHGDLPSMHSFRHTVASRALVAGESIDEIAFLLGHRDANVTRAVYVRELADVRRRSMRR